MRGPSRQAVGYGCGHPGVERKGVREGICGTSRTQGTHWVVLVQAQGALTFQFFLTAPFCSPVLEPHLEIKMNDVINMRSIKYDRPTR